MSGSERALRALRDHIVFTTNDQRTTAVILLLIHFKRPQMKKACEQA